MQGYTLGIPKGIGRNKPSGGWGVDAVKTWHILAGDPALAKCHGQGYALGFPKGMKGSMGDKPTGMSGAWDVSHGET